MTRLPPRFLVETWFWRYRGLLDEGRGAATGGAVGFRIPALLGRDREERRVGSGHDPVIQRRGHHRRRVGGGTEGAIVAFQTVVVLVGRDENERARDVKKEQPAEQRVESSHLFQSIGHRFPVSHLMFGTEPCSVNPVVAAQVPPTYPRRAAQIIPIPQTMRSTGQ